MRRLTRGLLTLAILLVGAACGGAATSAGGGASPGAYRSRADLITFEEIQQRGQYTNLYDVVEVLRPRWLRSRGPDTLTGTQGQVQVHMDGNRLGTVDVLRNLAAAGVTSIQWMNPIDAAARFGLDHSHGAIIISTAVVH